MSKFEDRVLDRLVGIEAALVRIAACMEASGGAAPIGPDLPAPGATAGKRTKAAKTGDVPNA